MQVRKIEETEWRAYLEECSTATFFHTPEWYEVWKKYAGYDYECRLFVFDSGVKAIFPLAWKKRLKGLMKSYFSSPVGTYGGVVSHDELKEKEIKEVQAYLKKITLLQIRANPLNEIFASSFFNIDDSTQVIDLNIVQEDIKKKWSKNHLRSLKKGMENGLSIREAGENSDWTNYYDIYLDSLRRWGTRVSSRYGWMLFEILSQLSSEKCKLWLVEKDDKLVSGCICFYHNKHVVYWHGASLESMLYLRPAHVLHHHIINDAVKKGFGWYDFNPSGGHSGVQKFKAGFGTETISAKVYSREPYWVKKLLAIRR